MALYRTISLTFWTDSKIIDDFTPEDRYFYLYLFTNPHTNLCGCYEISLKTMVNETGYSKETIERLINRFKESHKVIDYCTETKEILLVNWHKYNWTTSEKFRKPLSNEIGKVKNRLFRIYLSEIFDGNDVGYPIDTKCIDTNCSDTSVTDTVTDIYKDNNNNINNKENNNINNNGYSISFEQIYKLYPRKGEKKKAYACFQTRLKEGYSEEELMAATKNYAEFCEKEHRVQKYIKTAPTFYGVNTPFVDFLPKDSERGVPTHLIENSPDEFKSPYFGLPEEFFNGEAFVDSLATALKDINSGKVYTDEEVITLYYVRREAAANGGRYDIELRLSH